MPMFVDLIRYAHPNTVEQIREFFSPMDGGELSDHDLATLVMLTSEGRSAPIMTADSGRLVEPDFSTPLKFKSNLTQVMDGFVLLMCDQVLRALEAGLISAKGIPSGKRKPVDIPLSFWSEHRQFDVDVSSVHGLDRVTAYFAVQIRGANTHLAAAFNEWEGGDSDDISYYAVEKEPGRPRTTGPHVKAYCGDAVSKGLWQEPDAELARRWFEWGLEKGVSKFNSRGKEVPSIDWLRRRLQEAYEDRENYRGNPK